MSINIGGEKMDYLISQQGDNPLFTAHELKEMLPETFVKNLERLAEVMQNSELLCDKWESKGKISRLFSFHSTNRKLEALNTEARDLMEYKDNTPLAQSQNGYEQEVRCRCSFEPAMFSTTPKIKVHIANYYKESGSEKWIKSGTDYDECTAELKLALNEKGLALGYVNICRAYDDIDFREKENIPFLKEAMTLTFLGAKAISEGKAVTIDQIKQEAWEKSKRNMPGVSGVFHARSMSQLPPELDSESKTALENNQINSMTCLK